MDKRRKLAEESDLFEVIKKIAANGEKFFEQDEKPLDEYTISGYSNSGNVISIGEITVRDYIHSSYIDRAVDREYSRSERKYLEVKEKVKLVFLAEGLIQSSDGAPLRLSALEPPTLEVRIFKPGGWVNKLVASSEK